MEENRSENIFLQNPEVQVPFSCSSKIWGSEKDLQNFYSSSIKGEDSNCKEIDYGISLESILCLSGPKLVPSGFQTINCTDDFLMFVNTGGGVIEGLDSRINFKGDFSYHGGDVLRTDDCIINGGDCPSLYQSARYGNFCYRFDGLAAGDYFVDLHFAEIVNINGPKGMRIFDVYMQEEKVLSELDIYSVVGANKPLQLVDARVPVAENGVMIIRFEGIQGTPVVCGICIRKAPKLSAPLVNSEYLVCNNCSTKMEVPSTHCRARTVKDIAKYEKKLQELSSQCQLKADECYEAWMSLQVANDQLEKLRMELDNKFIQVESLDRTREKQAAQLKDVSDRYEHDKKFWVTAVNDLEGSIKAMKQEHAKLSKEAHECADSIPELNKMIFAVQAMVAQCEELKLMYSEELAKRKKLYNQVLETKGNIRVFCRCRPLSKEEISSGFATVVDFDAAKDGDLGILTGISKKVFKFDRVYTPKDDQVNVYEDASPLVVSVLDGYNVCIFAYGQTGTGKTFTMEGTEKNRGVNYRTLDELFKLVKERKDAFTYNISVSVLEVYNEQIRDLLATSPSSKKLEIRQAGEGSHHVPGIVEAKVENTKEVWDVLQAGSNARAVGSNNVNEHSSRSHCMLCIMVKAKNLMTGECTKSKLWLVDLAGSERLAKTDVQGERLKEAQNINRSLSALGDVISALAMKSSHVPYRNSKLTHLLQDSLGGDSKTLMFVQISPSENDLGETLSSLNFATRVRGVELGPVKKQIDTSELQKLKQMLDKAKLEARHKEESLRKLEENCQNLENKLRSKDQMSRNQQEKVKELEGQLESKMESQSQSERQLWQFSEKLKGKEEKIKELENKLKEQQHSESITLHLKIKELENKLKEQQHSESIMLQLKVKEFENKLKEQRHSEIILQQKVRELENKLKEQQHMEATVLQQKVKELENKRRESERSEPSLVHSPTRKDRRSFLSIDSMSETDPSILRSSNSTNRLMNHGSVLLRGADSLNDIRRKREKRSGSFGESENNHIVVPASFVEKKALATDLTARQRQLDSTKAFGRLARTSKPAATNQKIFSHSRINREQVGVKEREKTRVWSR